LAEAGSRAAARARRVRTDRDAQREADEPLRVGLRRGSQRPRECHRLEAGAGKTDAHRHRRKPDPPSPAEKVIHFFVSSFVRAPNFWSFTAPCCCAITLPFVSSNKT